MSGPQDPRSTDMELGADASEATPKRTPDYAPPPDYPAPDASGEASGEEGLSDKGNLSDEGNSIEEYAAMADDTLKRDDDSLDSASSPEDYPDTHDAVDRSESSQASSAADVRDPAAIWAADAVEDSSGGDGQAEPQEPETVPAAPAGSSSGEGMAFVERRRSPGRRAHDRLRRVGLIAAVVAGVLVSIVVLRYLSLVLVPFAVAFVLAYLLNPIANAVHGATKRRGLAVGITTVLVVGILGFGGWQLVPVAGGQVKDFADDLNTVWLEIQKSMATKELDRSYFPESLDEAMIEPTEEAKIAHGKSEVGWAEFLNAWRQYVNEPESLQSEAIARMRESTAGTYIGGVFDNTIMFVRNRPFNAMVNAMVEKVLVNGTTALLTLMGVVFVGGVIIVGVLYLVMLLSDFPEYSRVWQMFLPESYHGPISTFASEYHAVMGQYFVRQAIAAVVTAALFAMGFTYAGIPMAVPFGIFVGILSMVPYLQLAAVVPALLLAAFQAIHTRVEFTPLMLGVLVTFVVVQLVQELLIKPFVVGRGQGVERMGILLGAFLWPQLLGWLGLVIAIPLTCVVIALYRVKARQAEALVAAQREAASSYVDPLGDENLAAAPA